MKRSRIHTIHKGSSSYNSYDDTSHSHTRSSTNDDNELLKVKHLKGLPNEQDALNMLNRIRDEFLEILQCRKWNVLTVTEMCCCNGSSSSNNNKKKKKKKRGNDDNVWGYNTTTFRHRKKEHRITIRLRHPRSHILLEYEDIAGTMCHELAHCVYGNHSVKFYRLMEEIQKQHALYLCHNIVYDSKGFPLPNPTKSDSQIYTFHNNNQYSSLSSRSNTLATKKSSLHRQRVREAAEKRAKYSSLLSSSSSSSSPYFKTGGTSSGTLQYQMNPREAAKQAAEQRAAEQLWCLPCSSSDILQIWDSKSNYDRAQNDNHLTKMTKSVKTSSFQNNVPCVEILSLSDDDDECQINDRGIQVANNQNVSPIVIHDIIDLSDVSPKQTKHSNKGRFDVECYTKDEVNNPKIVKPPSVLKTNISRHQNINSQENDCHIQMKRKNNDDHNTIVNEGESWTCHKCTLTNRKFSSTCEACGMTRQIESEAPSIANNNPSDDDKTLLIQGMNKWNCVHCTFENDLNFDSCQVCHNLNPFRKKKPNNCLSTRKTNETNRSKFPSTSTANQTRFEKENSKQQFDGFDIYSGFRINSGSMKHLT